LSSLKEAGKEVTGGRRPFSEEGASITRKGMRSRVGEEELIQDASPVHMLSGKKGREKNREQGKAGRPLGKKMGESKSDEGLILPEAGPWRGGSRPGSSESAEGERQ